MSDSRLDLKRFIRDVPDFPKEGILFRDVTPLLQDPAAFRQCIDDLVEPFRDDGIARVVGIESRGFFLGGPVALALGAGLVIVRKAGKLPYRTLGVSYDLEYGSDQVEMHADSVEPGQRVLVVDDLIATGGTAGASIQLVRKAGAEVVGCAFMIELGELGGRAKIDVERIHTLMHY